MVGSSTSLWPCGGNDDVHDDVAAECRTVLRGKFSDAHDGVRVFGVDVEDRHGLAFGDIGGEARRMLLRGCVVKPIRLFTMM